MPLRLRIEHGDSPKEFEFDRTTVALGRGPLNDVAITHDGIAQKAGAFERDNDGVRFLTRGCEGFGVRLLRGNDVTSEALSTQAAWRIQDGDRLEFFRDESHIVLTVISTGSETAAPSMDIIPLGNRDSRHVQALVRAIDLAAKDPSPGSLLRAAAGLIAARSGSAPAWVALTIDPDGDTFAPDTYELVDPRIEDELGVGRVKMGASPLRMLGSHGRDILKELRDQTVAVCVPRDDGCTLAVPVHDSDGLMAVMAAHLSDADGQSADEAAHALHELDSLARLCLANRRLDTRVHGLAEENRYFRERQRRHYLFKELVCESPAMRTVYDALNDEVSLTSPALICGEAGTGKELLARALHHLGDRKHGMLISLNCARFGDGEIDIELFGCIQNQLSGAVAPRKGVFELADGGTVYLAEVDQLSPLMQGKLCRMLKEHEVRRVGDSESRPVTARVVVSVHRDLHELMRDGRIRRDLYLMLKDHILDVPPLRRRNEDIMPLARTFLRTFARRYGRTARTFSPEVEPLFVSYQWPGNARELQSRVESAVLKSDGTTLSLDHFRIE